MLFTVFAFKEHSLQKRNSCRNYRAKGFIGAINALRRDFGKPPLRVITNQVVVRSFNRGPKENICNFSHAHNIGAEVLYKRDGTSANNIWGASATAWCNSGGHLNILTGNYKQILCHQQACNGSRISVCHVR